MKRQRRSTYFRTFMPGIICTVLFAAFKDDDTILAGGGDDGGGNGGSGNPSPAPAPKEKTYTETEFKGVSKARDKFKRQMKALAKTLGVDPETLEFVETDDPDNPFEVRGLEDEIEAIEKARGETNDPKKKKEDAEAKRLRIARPFMRLAEQEKAKAAALQKWIERNAVIASIRLACAKNGAVDDDSGKFADIVEHISRRMIVTVAVEDDSEPDVTIVARDDEGNEFDGANGDVEHDANLLVSDLLTRRPKYRKAEFRAGPGAGGSSVGGQAVQSGRKSNAAKAVEQLTGIKPPSTR